MKSIKVKYYKGHYADNQKSESSLQQEQHFCHFRQIKNQQTQSPMQPLSQSIDQTTFIKAISSPSNDNLPESIQNKLYPETSFKTILRNEQMQSQERASNMAQSAKYQQNQSQLPQILDTVQTQETRMRHAILKQTIESTIQQLLHAYTARNATHDPEEQQRMKNQIFQRLAFIYSEMNEVKGDIQNAINFLNQGANLTAIQKNTPIKKILLPHGRITQKSQSFEESSSMKQEQNDQKNNQQLSDPNEAHASLQQRCQQKPNQSMDAQE